MGNRKIHFQTKEKIQYMIANNISMEKIALECGVGVQTCYRYAHKYTQGIVDKKKTLAEKYKQIADVIVKSISPKDIEKASLLQKMTASGIGTDKHLLLSGEPTANIQTSKKIVIIQSGTGTERKPGYKTIDDVLRERQKPVSVGDTNNTNTNNNNITNVH